MEREITAKHMGKGRNCWYLNEEGDMLPEFDTTEYGKDWRRKLAHGQLAEEEWSAIPGRLKEVFKCARMAKTKTGERITPDTYGDIFTSPITRGDFDSYIAHKKKNTAPGHSGIRIDHVAALSDIHKQMVCDMLSIVYLTGIGYSQWRKEIVNWIPKERGNHSLDKRRPLMYYEVLRKMCIGINKKKVLKIWIDNGIMDKDNYAFLPGFDTSDPLMIKKMVLEDAAFYKKKLTLIDVDFSKAYDSTEKFAKDISLRRMGFPEEGLDLWQLYDSDREMMIQTAYGMTDPITPECGAWGQGAEESQVAQPQN